MAKAALKVSVIIVSWNSRQVIGRCLESLAAEAHRQSATGLAMEVIVFDNASGDGTVDMVRSQFPHVICIASPKNLGFAAASNTAIRKSRGQFIFLLNPDTEVTSGCTVTLINALQQDPALAIAGPKVLQGDKIQMVCARQFPSLRASFFELFLIRRLFPHSRIFGRYRIEHWDHETACYIPCVLGAAMMVRRRFFDRHGLLDEQIPMFFEDIDLCARAWQRGWKVRYQPNAQVRHAAGASLGQCQGKVKLSVLEQGQAFWLYFQQYRGKPAAAAFSAIICSGSLFRLGILFLALPLGALITRSRRRATATAIAKYGLLLAWSLGAKDPCAIMSRISWD